MSSFELNPGDSFDVLQIPDKLPELVSTPVAEYLEYSDRLLREFGATQIIDWDYHSRPNLENTADNELASALVAQSKEVSATIEEFYRADLPLTVLAQKQLGTIIMGLVKVNEFGEAFAGYSIDLFSVPSLSSRLVNTYIPAEDGLSRGTVNAALLLFSKQVSLGWSPSFDLNRPWSRDS
ncbi:MAG: hypothetical protein ACREF7_04000 [Candidatus Saccharimonadales bacterium]